MINELLHIKLFKYDADENIYAIQKVLTADQKEPKILHYVVDGMLKELDIAIEKASEK